MLDLLSVLIVLVDVTGSVCLGVCCFRVLRWVLPRVDAARVAADHRPFGPFGLLVAPLLAALSLIL